MNQWVLRSSFPSVALEFVDEWRDRAEMGRPFVFERVVLADRSASMQSYNYQRYQRSAGPAFALPGSMNWWQPIRNNVVEFAGVSADIGSGTMRTPVITYISRQQWGRRMLIPEHHEKLVSELYRLRDEYGYEVNIVNAESMTRLEQIQLAARTTVRSLSFANGISDAYHFCFRLWWEFMGTVSLLLFGWTPTLGRLLWNSSTLKVSRTTMNILLVLWAWRIMDFGITSLSSVFVLGIANW